MCRSLPLSSPVPSPLPSSSASASSLSLPLPIRSPLDLLGRCRFVLGAFALGALAVAPAWAGPESTGPGEGSLTPGWEGSCGALLFHADATYENGYGWGYGGTVPPDYGAFAECYEASGQVCSVVFDFTQTGNQGDKLMDVYVWDDDGGFPGAVLASVVGADPGTIAFWPSVSRHVAPIASECLEGPFHVGFWGSWVGSILGWFVAADLNGPGGCPATNIAPGIGFPTGWSHVSVVWGTTQAIGIGCEVTECDPTPVRETTWGRVKSLF